jgi:hypothetical protein
MNLLNKTKQTFNQEIEKIARTNIKQKLQKQGIDYRELEPVEFESLVEAEREILESDTKKVGLGIGIGIAISMLTGF